MPRDEFSRLCQFLQELHQKESADGGPELDALIRRAVGSVPGAQSAGITISGRHHLGTASATARHPIVSDEIQNRQGEGPCLSAAWGQRMVRIDDLTADIRWPRYRREALRHTSIRSLLSFPLLASRRNAGALNFYADRTHVFDERSIEVGGTFATQVALAWSILERDRQFRSALASRDIIGQAKGLLIERFGIDAVAAFQLLKRLSQESNTPVAEVAGRLIRSRCLSQTPHAR